MDPALYNWTSSNTTLSYNNQSTDYKASSNISSGEAISILPKVSITLYSIISALGIIGNGLVIWIAGFRMKKTISAVWFLNLAIADFLCCASLPLQIAQLADLFSYSVITVCIFTTTLFTINMSASVLLLTAMGIDRCVSVMWPFWAKVHRTHRLVRITAAIVWVLSFLLTGLTIYLDGFYCKDIIEWCRYFGNINYANNIIRLVHLSRLVIMFVIPFLIILTSYVIILLKFRKSKRPQRSQRPYRIITAVILCFFICWCSYYILPIILWFDVGFNPIYSIFTIITILAYLNSCLNPIIYVFMGQDIKADFLRSIPARVETALTEHPDVLNGEAEDGENIHTTDV